MSNVDASGPDTSRIQGIALVVGAVGLIGAIVGGFFGAKGFFESYLVSYLFWFGISLGALALMFIEHLAGGPWGAMISRQVEAAVSLLPLLALLFIPLLFGLRFLYPWTDATYVASEVTVAAKQSYLNIPWFIIRAAIYFLIWSFAALLFRGISKRQDTDPAKSGALAMRMRSMGGIWTVVYVLTMNFAGIDWAMSLSPTWFSGIYPGILMASQFITALALVILGSVYLGSKNDAFDKFLTPRRLQDLGNLLMSVTMFWAYFHVSQLIILWSNNTVETSSWYVLRFNSTWLGVGSFLLFFGFFAPFGILFSRWVKRKRRALSIMAVWALFVQLLNLYWFVVPTFGRTGFQVTLVDLLMFVGFGGLWLGLYLRALASRKILPVNDPRFSSAIAEHAEPRGLVEHHA